MLTPPPSGFQLETNAKASKLVDSWTVNIFSDLAMLSELKRRIESIWPWNVGDKANDFAYSAPVLASTAKLYTLGNDVRGGIIDAFKEKNIFGVGNPLDGSFDYPATKRYTEANVNQMQMAEELLDDLWSKIELSVKKSTKYSFNGVVKRRLLEPRGLHRTPDWMPPLIVRTWRIQRFSYS